MKEKKEINKKEEKSKKNKIKRNHLFLIAMIILLIGVAGVGTIGYIMSNNSTVANDNILPSNINNTNNTTISNNESIKEEYTLITIHGLKCYVRTEYTNFIHVTDDTEYDGIDEYYELTEGKSVDFVDYSDFAQFFTRDGKFRIEISKSLAPKDLSYYNENNDDKNTSKNITVNGNKVNVVHISNYSDQTVTNKEFTFVYFKVKNKNVQLGWAGNTIDMYIIESFFKLN